MDTTVGALTQRPLPTTRTRAPTAMSARRGVGAGSPPPHHREVVSSATIGTSRLPLHHGLTWDSVGAQTSADSPWATPRRSRREPGVRRARCTRTPRSGTRSATSFSWVFRCLFGLPRSATPHGVSPRAHGRARVMRPRVEAIHPRSPHQTAVTPSTEDI
jgi:hypothetical protein